MVPKLVIINLTETVLPRNDVFDKEYKRNRYGEQIFFLLYTFIRTKLTTRAALKRRCNQIPYMAENRRFCRRQIYFSFRRRIQIQTSFRNGGTRRALKAQHRHVERL